MTTFPTNGDYVQALQHTDMCFRDSDLKAGRVDLTPLGIPRAISGNFASVFSITGSSGKRYAIKCFTREVKGQDERYRAIHDVLANLAQPWQVGFEYMEQGVLVDGQWHSILRMEWVQDSQTLIPWLEQNLTHPDRVLDLAGQFATCIGDMRRASIAHGDLQHGNLLVDANHRLRVIDYDGMFVPSIEHLGSNELGLANYQHPRRSGKDFSPDLDRFSAWLIYGSLIALAAQPGLWWTFRQQGDEKLLFGKDDFVPPFDAITRMGLLGPPHEEISHVLIESLASSTSLASVPVFDPKRIPLLDQAQSQSHVATSHTNPSTWWQQTATTAVNTATSDQAAAIARMGTGWLRSHEAPVPPIVLSGPDTAAKAMALVLTAVATLGAIALSVTSNVALAGLVLLTWATAMAVGVLTLWRRSDAVTGRAAARSAVKLAGREVARQQEQLSKARNDRTGLDADERRTLQKLEAERSKLSKSSTSEYERQTKDLRTRLAGLQSELSRLDASKAIEAQQQLKALQEQHIQKYMASRRIEPGVIHGIGPALAAALSIHGLNTAADIGAVDGNRFRKAGSNYWFTIHGIGPSKAFDIRYWHQQQLSAASSRAPQSLPRAQMQLLDTKFADQRRQKQLAIDSVPPQLQSIKTTIDAKYSALDREINLKSDAVRADYRRRRSVGDATVTQEATQLQRLEDALLDAQRNLARYDSVSFSSFLKA